jgi:hypothetical protein
VHLPSIGLALLLLPIAILYSYFSDKAVLVVQSIPFKSSPQAKSNSLQLQVVETYYCTIHLLVVGCMIL